MKELDKWIFNTDILNGLFPKANVEFFYKKEEAEVGLNLGEKKLCQNCF